MRADRFASLLISLTLISACHESSLPTSPGPPAINTQRYAIVGQVASAATRAPIGNVLLEALGNAAVPTVTRSDADGQFRLAGLRAGYYEILATGEGFVRSRTLVTVGGSNEEVRQDLFLERLPLITAYTLGGMVWVKGSEGRSAYVDARVEVLDGPQAGLTVMSDEMGMYLFRDLLPGTVRIRASRGDRSDTATIVLKGDETNIWFNFAI